MMVYISTLLLAGTSSAAEDGLIFRNAQIPLRHQKAVHNFVPTSFVPEKAGADRLKQSSILERVAARHAEKEGDCLPRQNEQSEEERKALELTRQEEHVRKALELARREDERKQELQNAEDERKALELARQEELKVWAQELAEEERQQQAEDERTSLELARQGEDERTQELALERQFARQRADWLENAANAQRYVPCYVPQRYVPTWDWDRQYREEAERQMARVYRVRNLTPTERSMARQLAEYILSGQQCDEHNTTSAQYHELVMAADPEELKREELKRQQALVW